MNLEKAMFNRTILELRNPQLTRMLRYGFLLPIVLLFTYGQKVAAQTDEQKVAVLAGIVHQFMSKVTHPNGVCLYSEPNFQGNRECFTTSQPSLTSAWNDSASSISVSINYETVVYKGANYSDTSAVYIENMENLSNFDNIISSLKVDLKDTDNDGVAFSQDQCPNTPIGESVSSNGCSLTQLDSDFDGVNDATDQCPSTPVGESVSIYGCSHYLDSDSDGVLNVFDDCPDTPANASVDLYGCSGSTSASTVHCIHASSGVVRVATSCNANENVDTDQDGIIDQNDPYPLQSANQCPAQ